LGVVPDEISAWKPETAPQAMVMNRKGNRLPENRSLPSINGSPHFQPGDHEMPIASATMVDLEKVPGTRGRA
jgi:hypothetical protein